MNHVEAYEKLQELLDVAEALEKSGEYTLGAIIAQIEARFRLLRPSSFRYYIENER